MTHYYSTPTGSAPQHTTTAHWPVQLHGTPNAKWCHTLPCLNSRRASVRRNPHWAGVVWISPLIYSAPRHIRKKNKETLESSPKIISKLHLLWWCFHSVPNWSHQRSRKKIISTFQVYETCLQKFLDISEAKKAKRMRNNTEKSIQFTMDSPWSDCI